MDLVLFLYLFMFIYLSVLVQGDYVGQSVSGEVDQGNYTYYTLRQEGHVQMVLTSHTGDADLYIADVTNERPTFMFDEHHLSSTTCGVDVVDLPPSFARPVHIGVYGHPNYILSTYTLEGVIVEDQEFDPFAQASYEENNEHFNEENTNESSKGRKRSERSNSDGFDQYFRDGSPLRILFTILGGILEILLEILI